MSEISGQNNLACAKSVRVIKLLNLDIIWPKTTELWLVAHGNKGLTVPSLRKCTNLFIHQGRDQDRGSIQPQSCGDLSLHEGLSLVDTVLALLPNQIQVLLDLWEPMQHCQYCHWEHYHTISFYSVGTNAELSVQALRTQSYHIILFCGNQCSTVSIGTENTIVPHHSILLNIF